jgi:hypothetical protein
MKNWWMGSTCASASQNPRTLGVVELWFLEVLSVKVQRLTEKEALVVYPWEIYPYIFNDGIFCLSLVGC